VLAPAETSKMRMAKVGAPSAAVIISRIVTPARPPA